MSVSSNGFGAGDMPREAYRFNWGAFFLTPLWAIAHASAATIGWWMVGILATITIASMLTPTSAVATIAIAGSMASVIEIAVRLWVGVNANAWLWKRERARLEIIEGSQPRFTLAAYQIRQLRWMVAGAIITVLSMAGLAVLYWSSAPDVVTVREQFGVTRVQVATSALWTFAEVVFAAWLAAQMRREHAEGAVGAPPA